MKSAATLACLLVGLAGLACLVQVSDARSSGILGYCDLTPQTGWPNGKFGTDKTNPLKVLGSGVMPWTAAPTAADFYTLRAGDAEPALDATTYTPGRTVELHLRVKDVRRRYIGLVLYAINGTMVSGSGVPTLKEAPVGNFTLIEGDSLFQINPSCGGRVLTHTDADLKPLHTRFFWTAPVGTGQVTFRVLLKQGEQNKGAFFWPKVALRLSEGPAPAVIDLPRGINGTALPFVHPAKNGGVGPVLSQTVFGEYGMACADVCFKKYPATPYCDGASISKISDVATLKSTIAGRAPCQLPLLAGCPYAGAAAQRSDGYCLFRAPSVTSTCPAVFNSSEAPHLPDVCFTAPRFDSKALCVCSNDKTVQAENPFTAAAISSGQYGDVEEGEEDEQSAAASASGNALLRVAAALVALFAASSFGSAPRGSFALLVVLALVLVCEPASAHNYIKTHHRAREAAVSNPCQMRLGNQPHVQVRAGQPWEMEWSMGHGDYTTGPYYFTLIHESDYDQLRAENFTAILKDYVALAPESARLDKDPYWQKRHIRNINELKEDKYWVDPAGLPPGHPDLIVREQTYATKANPSQYKNLANVQQLMYKPEWLTSDRRVKYASAKYPWIESVSVFYGNLSEHEVFNNQANLARFALDARKGPGDYIAHFFWQGYKDCVDINVVPGTTDVAQRYGTLIPKTAPMDVVKMDHCEYLYVGWVSTGCYKLPPNLDATRCIEECKSKNNNDKGEIWCNSVQVVRAKNLPSSLYAVPNIPFVPTGPYNQTAEDLKIFQPCRQMSVHDRVTAGCNTPPVAWCDPAKMNLGPDDFVCYGTTPMRNQDNQVEEDFIIVKEPEDPKFYSTCYSLVPTGGFPNIPKPVYKAPSWSTGDQCVSCDFHDSVTKLNLTQVANWAKGLTNQCMDCNVVRSKAPLAEMSAALVGKDQPFAGMDAATPPPRTSGSGSGSSPSSGGVGGGVLIIIIIAVGVVAIGVAAVGVTMCVRNQRAKASASSAMSNIYSASSPQGARQTTELTGGSANGWNQQA